MMKYGITLLLLISYTAHAGLTQSRQRKPLQYIYVTPTLTDDNATQTYTGKYSYIDFSDGTFQSAERPSQPRDFTHYVDIESAELSSSADPRAGNPLKSMLAITYTIKKRTELGTVIVQEAENATFNFPQNNSDPLEKLIPAISATLKISVSRMPVHNEFRKN